MNVETIELTVKRYCSQARVAPENLRLHRFTEDFSREIVLVLEASLYTKNALDVSFQWPSTWWDALKDRWFPAWAKRRWPTKWEFRRVTGDDAYPMIKVNGNMPTRIFTTDSTSLTTPFTKYNTK